MNIFKTTALYGRGFKATEMTGVYALRVYTGGFAGIQEATERAKQEARKFLIDSQYSDFKIAESKRIWFPFSCVDFLVAFSTP
jgi:hypothetical protein